MRVLLVEKYQSFATSRFSAGDSVVLCAEDADEALSLLKYETFDVVLVNMEARAQDGFELIRRMRAARNDTPILALTGAKVDDRTKALDLGADDALSAPVDPKELDARLACVLRRSRGFSQSLLQVGDLSLCMTTRKVHFRDTLIRTTPRETALLELMILRRGLVLTKTAILTYLYGGLDEPEIKIIDVFVCKLRKKLDRFGMGHLIVTVWGRGYTMSDRGSRLSATIGINEPPNLKLVA